MSVSKKHFFMLALLLLLNACFSERLIPESEYTKVYQEYFQPYIPNKRHPQSEVIKNIISTKYNSDTILNYFIRYTGIPEWEMAIDFGEYYWVPYHQIFYDSLGSIIESQINCILISRSGDPIIFEYDPIGSFELSTKLYDNKINNSEIPDMSIIINSYWLGVKNFVEITDNCFQNVHVIFEDKASSKKQKDYLPRNDVSFSGYKILSGCSFPLVRN